jgi:hypothetical protein
VAPTISDASGTLEKSKPVHCRNAVEVRVTEVNVEARLTVDVARTLLEPMALAGFVHALSVPPPAGSTLVQVVGVLQTVTVTTAVFEGVDVGVCVGVIVGVRVGVLVAVFVGV